MKSLDYEKRLASFLESKDAQPFTVQQAIRRHAKDLKNKQLEWRSEEGARVCAFLETLVQTKGNHAGKALHLEPWQVFFVMSLYSWYRRDGYRRFIDACLSVPRKNGKTTIAAGLAIYELLREQGAEVYIAAQDRGQAGILFNDVVQFTKNTEEVKSRLVLHTGANTKQALHPGKSGVLKPLHADSDRLDGLNPSCVIYDEFFASKNSHLFDVLHSAIGARQAPLMVLIGSHTDMVQGFGFMHEQKLRDVLSGEIENDDQFVLIFEPDKEDDLDDPAIWKKVNPNYGVSIVPRSFKAQYDDARKGAQQWLTFQQKNLNRWTVQTVTSWLPEQVTEKAFQPLGLESYQGRECVMAFDLSAKNDLTALAIAFPGTPGAVFFRFWIPETTISDRMQNENPAYQQWIEDGHVKVIPGPRIDDTAVFEEIVRLCEEYELRPLVIRYDRWKAQDLVKRLEAEGFIYEDFPPYPRKFGPAILATEEALYKGGLVLENNPLAKMCLYYARTKVDFAGNPVLVKPELGAKRKRIDGAVVLVMAWGTLSTMLDASGEVVKSPEGLFSSGEIFFQ